MTPYELRQQQRRALAAPDASPMETLTAAVRFWCHCQGLAEQQIAALMTSEPRHTAACLVEWLKGLGWPAQALHTRQHRMGDFVWIHDARGARFVVCQGEQPGLRIAYWDPCDGEHHWRALADLQTGSGDHQDLVVRPRATPLLQGAAPGRRRGRTPMSWPMKLLAWRSRQGE